MVAWGGVVLIGLGIEDEIRILAPNGVIGSGFKESSFEAGLQRRPHFIGVDAGSSDGGPSSLGTGRTGFSRAAIKRDLRIALVGARRLGIPVLVGSCGTAGADVHLATVVDIVEEIARENELSFNLATISSEQDREYLIRKYDAGQIVPLFPAPEINHDTFRNASRIVGMMGAEPFVAAIEAGADLVLAGRSSDTAIFAALPVHLGFPAGLAWHAAKILECGAAAVTHRKQPDSMLGIIRKDHFIIEPLDPALRCTPQSVAAHSLYENSHPYRIVEPAGVCDLTNAVYEAVDDRIVRVTGSQFEPAEQYTIKLEGAELIGYQSVVLGAVRDPYIIRQLDDWLVRLREAIATRVGNVYGDTLSDKDYTLTIHEYGRNGVMGDLEPLKDAVPHEVALLFLLTAPTQEIATSLASITRHQALHLPIPEWSGLITTIACPFSPAYLDRGPVYRFNLNHVVQVDDPLEMFRIEHVRVGSPS
jgi:hypothetical protein